MGKFKSIVSLELVRRPLEEDYLLFHVSTEGCLGYTTGRLMLSWTPTVPRHFQHVAVWELVSIAGSLFTLLSHASYYIVSTTY